MAWAKKVWINMDIALIFTLRMPRPPDVPPPLKIRKMYHWGDCPDGDDQIAEKEEEAEEQEEEEQEEEVHTVTSSPPPTIKGEPTDHIDDHHVREVKNELMEAEKDQDVFMKQESDEDMVEVGESAASPNDVDEYESQDSPEKEAIPEDTKQEVAQHDDYQQWLGVKAE